MNWFCLRVVSTRICSKNTINKNTNFTAPRNHFRQIMNILLCTNRYLKTFAYKLEMMIFYLNLDIDECAAETHNCSASNRAVTGSCQNLHPDEGKFNCSCEGGFEWKPSTFQCKGNGFVEEFVTTLNLALSCTFFCNQSDSFHYLFSEVWHLGRTFLGDKNFSCGFSKKYNLT